MHRATRPPSIDSNGSSRERLIEVLTAAGVLTVAVGAYFLIFNRANVLSHSIGYNLYASERVLNGDVPYRDFHTLYPPAIFYLNAVLFNWSGVTLYTSLIGVLVFKVLTVVVIYLSGRQMMPRSWALISALSGLLWLRPNGPFKSVPMHYGALFLALAMYLLLKHSNQNRRFLVFLAGASLGLVALFKHNIGAYALVGSIVFLLFDGRRDERQSSGGPAGADVAHQHNKLKPFEYLDYRGPAVLLMGSAATIAPALIFMQLNGALIPMIKTLLFGPGEFLLSRLAIPLSPIAPFALVVAIAVTTYATYKLRRSPTIAVTLWLILIVAVSVFLLRHDQADIDQIIFYAPMLVLASGLGIAVFNRTIPSRERRALIIQFIFAAAALMELFPRLAREQSIAAMPFVMLFLFSLLYVSRPAIRVLTGAGLQCRLALAVLPLIFSLIEARLFFRTYFDGDLHIKAGTRVNIERGRGVYFPEATAALIDNAVNYIQQRVPTDGNAFAQSDAGTSLLFLANRRNVSKAQFWIGVGVTQEERAATLDRIDKSGTKLIITSDDVLAGERYAPVREYIERNFKATARFDDVVMLER